MSNALTAFIKVRLHNRWQLSTFGLKTWAEAYVLTSELWPVVVDFVEVDPVAPIRVFCEDDTNGRAQELCTQMTIDLRKHIFNLLIVRI